MNTSVILGYYHQVRPWPPQGLGLGLGVAPETVARHAAVLRAAGYALATVSNAASAAGKAAALTFDDGYADNLEHAVPALAAIGAVGTVYVVVSEIGRDRPSWAAGATAGTDRLLTAAELREMLAAGWEIGSHCEAHVRLPQLSPEAQREQIRASKARLEDTLSHPVRSLAYPYGAYGEIACKLAEEAGYTTAVTTAKRGGSTSPFAVSRYSLGGYRLRAARQNLKLRLAIAARRRRG
jgi:peptidoglycan/xylan/chitin deacetylase (PgdA/CDA1 family)